jgi:cystathionine beta-synthase
VRDLLAKKRGGGSLVSVGPDKTAKQVLSVLSQYNISQLPVIDGDRCVGSVKEGDLMARIIEVPATMDVSIGRLMGPPYPVVTESDPLDHVARLFTRDNDAVVVMAGGAIGGILTRYDLIQHLTGR